MFCSMIRNSLIFLVILLPLSACKNNNIEITGKLTNPFKDEYIYLDELRDSSLETIDSALIGEDGAFSFSLRRKAPAFYLLKTDETNFLTMLLEPGQIAEINAPNDSLNFPGKIKGSRGTELMAEYNRKLSETISSLSGLREIYLASVGTPDLPLVMERLDSTARTYLDDISSYTKKYIDENLSSLVALTALYQQIAPGEYVLNPQKDLEYFLKVDSSLYSLYPDYEPVKTLHEQVMHLVSDMTAQNIIDSRFRHGTEAPEITLPDTAGNPVKLSSSRGNIVLLDFWAAWCPPCRMENPNLVKAYDLYHDRGFTIFQVSLDRTKEAWTKGIREDNLGRWIHVSDLKYWNSEVIPVYNLEQIPTSYLLDREGRIIASNLRGDELLNRLEQIFN